MVTVNSHELSIMAGDADSSIPKNHPAKAGPKVYDSHELSYGSSNRKLVERLVESPVIWMAVPM